MSRIPIPQASMIFITLLLHEKALLSGYVGTPAMGRFLSLGVIP
jgi:hypothetical protein